MPKWTVAGIELPATVIFTPASTSSPNDGIASPRAQVPVVTRYEGRGDAWMGTAAATAGAIEALEVAWAEEEWLPAWPDDSSVAPFVAIIRNVQAFIRDADGKADFAIVLEVLATTSTKWTATGETQFLEHDF